MAKAKNSKRPSVELFEQVFGKQARYKKFAALKAYLERGDSIFPLVEKGPVRLAEDFGLSIEYAQKFLLRANALAIYLRRRYIEQLLTGETTPSPYEGGFNTGPSYELLFPTNFHEYAPVGALEDSTGVVGYLVQLWTWVRDNIEPYGDLDPDTGRLFIHERRPDIEALMIDHNAMNKTISAVDIILDVLKAFIAKHTDGADLDEQMIERRHPYGLPYYRHWATINAVVIHHGLSVGHFSRWTSAQYPNFLQPDAWDEDGGRALELASELGPFQRALLTEDPVTDDADQDTKEAFYAKNYGLHGVDFQSLNEAKFFGARTRQDSEAIAASLSLRSYAPTRSDNVHVYEESATHESERSGSVFINAGKPPALDIDYLNFSPRLSKLPNIHPETYDRMNRKRRLDLWLDVSPEQVDLLLVAAFNAERAGDAENPEPPDIWITDKTVQSLGLFQTLRRGYGCKAADFAVFIDKMSLYGRGQAPSQFDEIFNNVLGNYREPLVIDGGDFPLLLAPGVSELTVNRICSALKIDLQTYQYLAQAIARAHGLTNKLQRSPEILSAFYRLVKLPRLLNMTPVEGLSMLTVLGGEAWVNGLAGIPAIRKNRETRNTVPDVLDLVSALVSCRYWCQTRNLPVPWMLQQVTAPEVSNEASEPEQRLFGLIHDLLDKALLTNASFLRDGVRELPGRDWRELMPSLTDPQGLVKSYDGCEAEYLMFARQELDKAVEEGLNEDSSVRAPIVEIMLTVLLQARDAQLSIAGKCLAQYTELDAERSLRVLSWANSTVYKLLTSIVEHMAEEWMLPLPLRSEPLDPLFKLLAEVRRRSAIVSELDLSLETLSELLDYGINVWWKQVDRHAVVVSTVYYLSVLAHAFEISEPPHTDLLDYLRQVNELGDPDKLSEDALRLAQQASVVWLARLFDWSEQEVHECVGRIDPIHRLLKNLEQLDLLVRVRELARHTGMDALTVFLLGTLPRTVDGATDKAVYKDVAERALLSLTETAPAIRPSDELRAPLVNMQIVPDKTTVVAGSSDTIVITITLTDQNGEPLSGVAIHGQASLGTVVTSVTDPDGVAQAIYTPGKAMGTERLLFWVQLFSPQEADPVQLTDDVATLVFPPPLMSKVPVTRVAAGQTVEPSAVLEDAFKNRGKSRPVQWTVQAYGENSSRKVEAVIKAARLTTQDGFARAFVSSVSGGKFRFTVTSTSMPDGDSVDFDWIEFVPAVRPR